MFLISDVFRWLWLCCVVSGSKVGGFSITTFRLSCLGSCSPGQCLYFENLNLLVLCLVPCSDMLFVLRPEGVLYQMFRNQFITYCLYQSETSLVTITFEKSRVSCVSVVTVTKDLYVLFHACLMFFGCFNGVWRMNKPFYITMWGLELWTWKRFVLWRRFCPVSAVLLPERLFVPTENAGRKTHDGPDSRSVPSQTRPVRRRPRLTWLLSNCDSQFSENKTDDSTASQLP